MTGRPYSQIIHVKNPQFPAEGLCGIVFTGRLHDPEYHKIEEIDYVLNDMWHDDLLCRHCAAHPDYPLLYLSAV